MSERAGVPRDACRVGWGDVGRYLHTNNGPEKITAITFDPTYVYIATQEQFTAHRLDPHQPVIITGVQAVQG